MSYSFYVPSSGNTGGSTTTTVSGISQMDADQRYVRKGTNIDMGGVNRVFGLPHPTESSQPVTRTYLENELTHAGALKGQKGDPGKDSTVPGPRGPAGPAGKDSTLPGPRGPAGPAGSSTIPQVTQNLSMRGYRIEQLGTPVNTDDATSKSYVDGKPKGISKVTADNLYLGLGGGSLREGLHFVNASKITNLGNPQNATDAENKRYLDSKIVSSGGITQLTADNRYLSLNGGGLKGNLNMNNKRIANLAAPTASKDATTKKWVEDKFATKSTLTNRFLPLSLPVQ